MQSAKYEVQNEELPDTLHFVFCTFHFALPLACGALVGVEEMPMPIVAQPGERYVVAPPSAPANVTRPLVSNRSDHARNTLPTASTCPSATMDRERGARSGVGLGWRIGGGSGLGDDAADRLALDSQHRLGSFAGTSDCRCRIGGGLGMAQRRLAASGSRGGWALRIERPHRNGARVSAS